MSHLMTMLPLFRDLNDPHLTMLDHEELDLDGFFLPYCHDARDAVWLALCAHD